MNIWGAKSDKAKKKSVIQKTEAKTREFNNKESDVTLQGVQEKSNRVPLSIRDKLGSLEFVRSLIFQDALSPLWMFDIMHNYKGTKYLQPPTRWTMMMRIDYVFYRAF